MPRLTPRDYLAHPRLLIEEWYEHDAIVFGKVPLPGQHDLHDFFAPTEPFSDAEALKHRATMTKAFPALPQKAGRALQMILAARERLVQQAAAPPAVRPALKGNARSRGVRIEAVACPHVDVYHLAKALIGLAESDPDGSLLEEMLAAQKRKSR